MLDALDQFASALAARGIIPDQIEADGRLHRCPVAGGKSGRQDGSYIFHLDDRPAGGFQNHRDGLGWENWSGEVVQSVLTAEQRAARRTQIEAIRRERAADEVQRHTDAAKRAARLLSRCRLATNDHAYLRSKGVSAYGLRQLREQLVLPLRDTAGVLWSLQFISPEGEKRFLTGGRKRGCYFPIGVPDRVLCLAEGYSTGASVFESTDYATAVALDSGNLEPVARALRAKFPHIAIIICADNDCETPGNPGVTCARAAARAVGGHVAVPSFHGVAT